MIESKDGAKRSLEEEFFARQNQELLKKLQADKSHAQAKAELAQYSGIKDDAVLESLVKNKVQTSTLVALSLVPLVLTAWADGSIDAGEQKAILQAMSEQGIESDHPSYALVQDWLKTPPGPQLFETWQNYVKGLGQSIDRASFEKLKDQIMKDTRKVAESAGGILGLGSKVSAAEKAQLAQLEKAFQ